MTTVPSAAVFGEGLSWFATNPREWVSGGERVEFAFENVKPRPYNVRTGF